MGTIWPGSSRQDCRRRITGGCGPGALSRSAAVRTAFAEMLVMVLKRRNPAATEAMEGRTRTRILGVPLIIAVGAHIETGGPIPEIEQLLWVGAAAANMLNAIHARDLIWMRAGAVRRIMEQGGWR
jgi:hypothetical protein